MSQENILSIVCEKQNCLKWCWAAVAVSINNYFATIHQTRGRPLVTEGQLANRFITSGEPDCCASPPPAACDQEYDVSSVLTALKAYRGDYTHLVPWEILVQEIDDSLPLVGAVRRRTGQQHFILIVGYKVVDASDNGKLYIVKDPAYGNVPMGLNATALRKYEHGTYVATGYTADRY
ncbi:papain-like cysteine protease family protein [Candidatus Entotheonella palauensis]|uniref:Peptidase C39-like domain-containing protein n=1 Tax=Candidatus Entotheonella gemina TaxID=1429439 RepID=W4M2I5_9BACT|nr:papain-like cysteine protease family protein [Candidatus Entotheonella palauensis]ETX04559.1 MAG: hypothetical protein ETSY2_28145 [Candidatus Entotheonella gemina]